MNPNLLTEAEIARRADQRNEAYQIVLAGIWAAIALIIASTLVLIAFVVQGGPAVHR